MILVKNLQKKKKTKSNPSTWEKNINQNNRLKGIPYMGIKKSESGDYKYTTKKEARNIGERCASSECAKVRDCTKVTDEERKALCDYFWANMDWNQRKVYVCSLVSASPPMRRRKECAEDAPRKLSAFKYHLKVGGICHHVCKKMFLSTFCLGEWSVRNWVLSGCDGMHKSKEANKMPNKSHGIDTKHAEEFLDMLPKMPSHYCRASTSKLYLEPIIGSKEALYALYRENCIEKSKTQISKTSFYNIFYEKNIALFQPKKDQCDLCIEYNLGSIDEDVYNSHQTKKVEARDEKNMDKTKAENNELQMFTMDLQGVKLAPVLKASAMYYKTKLCVHNFTIHNSSNRDVWCYLWNETEGGLESSVFASCIVDFLQQQISLHPVSPLILFSDGCTYQNRNSVLSNALLLLAKQNDLIIIQKFLERGHTQMEVDSVHSTIEQKLKKEQINLPSDYIQACEKARKKLPYHVKYLEHSFFKDFTKVKYYSSIRPGNKKGDPVVTDIVALKYTPTPQIFFKLRHSSEWELLPQRIKNGDFEVPRLYNQRLEVTEQKFSHLQDLKRFVPADCRGFYENLPHK